MGARNEKRKSGRKRGEAQSGSAAAPARPRRVLSGRGSLWSEAVEGRVLVSAPEGAERRGWRDGISRPVSEAADLYQDKHTFYSQLPNLNGFERNFRSDFSGKKSHSFFQFDSEIVSCVLEGMHGWDLMSDRIGSKLAPCSVKAMRPIPSQGRIKFVVYPSKNAFNGILANKCSRSFLKKELLVEKKWPVRRRCVLWKEIFEK